jgi:hypothetical protein
VGAPERHDLVVAVVADVGRIAQFDARALAPVGGDCRLVLTEAGSFSGMSDARPRRIRASLRMFGLE